MSTSNSFKSCVTPHKAKKTLVALKFTNSQFAIRKFAILFGLVFCCTSLRCFNGAAREGGYLNSGPTVEVGAEVLDSGKTSLEIADQIKTELDKVRKERESLKTDLAGVRAEKEDAEVRLAEAERRRKLAEKRLDEVVQENEELTTQLHETRKKLTEAEMNLDSARTNLARTQLAEVKAQQKLIMLQINQFKNGSTQSDG